MVTGSTSTKDDSATSTNGRKIGFQASKSDFSSLKVDSTSHGVDNTLGLFVDFLLHEMVKGAFHDFSNFHFKSLDGSDARQSIVTSQTVDMELSFLNVRNVVVFKIEDSLGVLNNGRRIRSEKEFNWLRHSIFTEECSRLASVHFWYS